MYLILTVFGIWYLVGDYLGEGEPCKGEAESNNSHYSHYSHYNSIIGEVHRIMRGNHGEIWGVKRSA